MDVSRRGLAAGAAALLGAGAAEAQNGTPMSDDPNALHVPAQIIPVPTSISPEAQAYLAGATRRIAAMEASGQTAETGPSEQLMQGFRAMVGARFRGTEETIDLPHGAKLYRMIPEGRAGRKAEVAYFDIHGGGFVSGGGEMCLLLAKMRAADFGVEVYSVDYRLLPEHQYPAPLDDCMAAYREVLNRVAPENLAVGGNSAGGNLIAATLLRARAEGLPMPCALALGTPGLDMTRSGDTYRTNQYLDVALRGSAGRMNYGAGSDLAHPYVSPIFGTFENWPPTILFSGTRDLLLSDTVRMHRALRRANVRAELHVVEAGPHGNFQGMAPEDHEIMAENKSFLYELWRIQA
jgi:monoterpene epsilon-lactone hydrolase